jgi:hypothetical protein
MIMRLFTFLLISGMLILSVSCEKKNPVINNEAKLLGITLISGKGVIDTANNQIILKVPDAVDLTKIVPHFEISANATIYPPSDVATNYSDPVVYTITSEDKSEQYIFSVSAVKAIAKLTVYDCSTWTVAVPRVPQPGAVIKIFTSEEDVNTSKTFDVLTTDQDGKADLYGVRETGYFVTVAKDSKSDIINGYVLDGKYDNQDEIDNSPIDPNAVIGGFKFKDVNGDWRVWPDDKYNFDRIYVPAYYSGVQLIDLYIAGAKK